MVKVHAQKTSFAAGELSPSLYGRSDLRAYVNGAARLENVIVNPTGGVSRRAGLRFMGMVSGPARLIAFAFNREQEYLIVALHRSLRIYRDGVLIKSLTAPWTTHHLAQLNYVQSADTLLLVHPDIAPHQLTRTGDSTWNLSQWVWASASGVSSRLQQPHHHFADRAMTMRASGTAGTVNLYTSANFFTTEYVGMHLRLRGREVIVSRYISPTHVQATVVQRLVSTAASSDWSEPSFSAVRGWPVSVCFHQDRLVIGGSRDLPNQVWLSRSGDLFNFDLGTGLDDECISFAILSDQVNAIRQVFSGRHLQVFTSGAEWMVTGNPLTPENIQITRQTSIGSPTNNAVRPCDVDGATLFLAANGKAVHEFLFADMEQAYQSTDLTTLAKHLIKDPIKQDYNAASRTLYVINADGSLATLSIYRAEQVRAWSKQVTQGAFKDVTVVNMRVYVLTERAGRWYLEYFDDTCNTDSALTGHAKTPKNTWSGISHLDGKDVVTIDTHLDQTRTQVKNGRLTLDDPTNSVEVGLPYAHTIMPLPPVIGDRGSGDGVAIRPIAITFRLQDSYSLYLDTGRGFHSVAFRRFGSAPLDVVPEAFNGNKTVRVLGWRKGGQDNLWVISEDTPCPFTLLSVSTQLSANI